MGLAELDDAVAAPPLPRRFGVRRQRRRVTLELIFGIRFGAHIPWSFVLTNFLLAAAGNMIGGIGLVTLNRFTQARSGGRARRASG